MTYNTTGWHVPVKLESVKYDVDSVPYSIVIKAYCIEDPPAEYNVEVDLYDWIYDNSADFRIRFRNKTFEVDVCGIEAPLNESCFQEYSRKNVKWNITKYNDRVEVICDDIYVTQINHDEGNDIDKCNTKFRDVNFTSFSFHDDVATHGFKIFGVMNSLDYGKLIYA